MAYNAVYVLGSNTIISSDVFINAGSNTIQGLPIIDVSEELNIPEVQPGVTELQAAIHLKDEEIEDDGLAVFPSGTIQQSINNGLIANLPDPEYLDEDSSEPVALVDLPSDCSDIVAHSPIFPGSFQLTQNFTIADLTTNTAISNYALQAQGGLTTNEIVCNMRLLCINVLEPILAVEPTMFITSGFRHGSGASQHNRGQAVDIQFGGFNFDEYWIFAKVVRDSVQYDQFILELGNTYWYHLSFVSAGRHNVLTRIRPGKYVPGLVRIA